ncbi:MAG: bifunctional ADP-dependent NAD(P)H-hydrate dehydratase/NAD(P)H-hydrate epimerase [Treponema sp.]|jgi:NAD(P)H-hydrate epimerase|nr:bifunctional ADP-dependent NAD(P)H-hydrate dehydratase/NAD(P)H-hydrate epimerase [Treponema sp.]
MISRKLVSAGAAAALDREAASDWGLHPFALVEAAGRTCARVLVKSGFFKEPSPRICVLAGSGNNGADALVMLRALILDKRAGPGNSLVLVNRLSGMEAVSPRSEALKALAALEVPVRLWEGGESLFQWNADIVIDGIAGTGLRGPLQDIPADMAGALQRLRQEGPGRRNGGRRPLILSIDVPSGLFDGWHPGMPILQADLTLGIEPLKLAFYKPAARIFGGGLLPVGGIFPLPLMDRYGEGELLRWKELCRTMPPIAPDAYKYSRGVVEIRAGSPGSAGAARIAARGAQAAGGGMVRLLVDDALYPVLAASAGGIMVAPASAGDGNGGEEGRFVPDAVLLGPGWGRGADRQRALEAALVREKNGTPLILDADAVALARGRRFSGHAVLTPHPGEFTALTGIPKEQVLADPVPLLRRTAQEIGGVLLFKGHVLYIAAPDGRLGVLDGMAPVLAAGGTGDLLAGFCAALAARMRRSPEGFDGYACAAIAAALLLQTGKSARGFLDPLELADTAAALAGKAWL